MKNLFYLLTLSSLFFACSNSTQGKESSSDSSKKDSAVTAKRTIDTIYHYHPNAEIVMEIKNGDKTTSKKVFEAIGDTFYYDNGKPRLIIVGESADFDSKHYEYYQNGQLARIREQGNPFGCGAQVGEEVNYDSLGTLLSRSTYENSLPPGDVGCHQTYTVISTTEYYANGKVKLKKKEKTSYEAGLQCPCDKWEYYDEKGLLMKKEKHPSCENYKLDCEE